MACQLCFRFIMLIIIFFTLLKEERDTTPSDTVGKAHRRHNWITKKSQLHYEFTVQFRARSLISLFPGLSNITAPAVQYCKDYTLLYILAISVIYDCYLVYSSYLTELVTEKVFPKLILFIRLLPGNYEINNYLVSLEETKHLIRK